MEIFRKEHPQPQFERAEWLNLNGKWQFEIDNGRSGKDRDYMNENKELSDSIIVPFCPESRLSGVEHKDFINAVWYKRTFLLGGASLPLEGRRIELHIGACDYFTEVWINGKYAGSHKGGYTHFSFDITALVREGENTVTVYAEDDTRNSMIPSGKQSFKHYSLGCHYTRTTGIWQTVWLESTPCDYIKSVRFLTDAQQGYVTVAAELQGTADFEADIYYENKQVGKMHSNNVRGSGVKYFTAELSELHLWEPGHGRLYDIELRFGEDRVHSYFGIRSVAFDGKNFILNGRSVFQRLVLDQGFYPDGIYTAPDDEALLNDVRLSMDAGFNGARLHQKVFEPRFLYHCDKMGYMVWGEYPSWGLDHTKKDAIYSILPEWLEVLKRDMNHPSIVCWCPFNETFDGGSPYSRQEDDLLRYVYRVTKAADSSRPCVDTSGFIHVETDIFDLHDYDQNAESFAEHYKYIGEKGTLSDAFSERQTYDGKMPVIISEYGGIGLDLASGSWGYGAAAQSCDEFIKRYKALTDVLLDNPEICGMCYTQLYDVEQEQNGIYTYERTPKVDIEAVKAINTRAAAIEAE